MNTIKKLIKFCAKTEIFFYALIPLMGLVVLGTVAQKYIGLYQAQKIYFSSFYFFAFKYIPLPGGYTVLAIIFFNLICKLFISSWKLNKLGTNIVHIGSALLLFGGFLTAVFTQEGQVVLEEGQSSAYFSDYFKNELVLQQVVFDKSNLAPSFSSKEKPKHKVLNTWVKPNFIANKKVFFPKAKVTLNILHHYFNVGLKKRSTQAPAQQKGFITQFYLFNKKEELKKELNAEALVFKVKENQFTYGIFEGMPIAQTLVVNNKKFIISLRRKRYPLPVSVKLIDFKKINYAGSLKARNYQSFIEVKNKAGLQKALIEMNQPFRYGEYTFYQASFSQENQTETSVLAVVKNKGRVFPYLASLIMCFGLLFHLLAYLPKVLRRS
ncbi:MAG: cytochrome c biogenesis protein ResB [Bdellovibrionaceae bacterium]|nr:cytochrome c biogenesis protein ResB [Pseudobdellovibrionaceae bacterium]